MTDVSIHLVYCVHRLALLFGVLALAIPSSIEKGSLRAETIGESSAASAATKFYRRSIHFFEMAEAHEKPQFRGLQTLLLYIVHLGTVDKDNYGELSSALTSTTIN